MKAVAPILLVTAVVPFLIPRLAPAQETRRTDDQALNTQAYEELLKSDVNAKRQMLIKEIMQFSESEGKAFWPIFQKYDEERAKLDQAEAQLMREYVQAYQSISDDKADQLLRRSFELEAQRAQLKKRYFDIMKKALSPRVAARFFEVENQIQHIYQLQVAANLPTNQ
jgi:hypothetical protein